MRKSIPIIILVFLVLFVACIIPTKPDNNSGSSKYVSLTSGIDGMSVSGGDSYTITWSTSGYDYEYVEIYLLQSGSVVDTIASYTSNDGSYYWTIPSLNLSESDYYQFRIVYADNRSVYDESGYFTIEISDYLELSSLIDGMSVNSGDDYSITWSTSGGYYDYVNIYLFNSGSTIDTIAEGTGNDGTYSWAIPSSLSTSSWYQIGIEFADDQSVYSLSSYFTITYTSTVAEDLYESDNYYYYANSILVDGTTQSHTLTDSDEDWLTFDGYTGYGYIITTTGSTDTYLRLYTSDGTTLLLEDDDSGTDNNAQIDAAVTSSGTFYIKVTGTGSTPAGNYSISVTEY